MEYLDLSEYCHPHCGRHLYRCGGAGADRKSTFIKRFMETQIIPNIDNVYRREQTEISCPKRLRPHGDDFWRNRSSCRRRRPRSSAGGARPFLSGLLTALATWSGPWARRRMILPDGHNAVVRSSHPHDGGGGDRHRKVIAEHSTIGIVITTDGSISDIPRGLSGTGSG